MHSIVLPTMGSTLGRNRPFPFLNGLCSRVLFCLDSGFFGLYASELLKTSLAGVCDAVLGLAILSLDLIGGSDGLPGGLEGALASRRAARRPSRGLLVLAQNALRCTFTLVSWLSVYHGDLFSLGLFLVRIYDFCW